MVYSNQENQIKVEEALAETMKNKMKKLDEIDTLYQSMCAGNLEKVS